MHFLLISAQLLRLQSAEHVLYGGLSAYINLYVINILNISGAQRERAL